MYNSVFVNTMFRIGTFIKGGYNTSLLKRVIHALNKNICYLSRGSRFKSLFASGDSLIEKSYIYNIYAKFMNILNKLLENIRVFIIKNAEYSIIYQVVKDSFDTKLAVLRTASIFTFTFGIGIAINNVLRGYYSGRSYYVSLILVIFSLVSLWLKENYKEILKNSLGYKFVYSIFEIDRGGDNWW